MTTEQTIETSPEEQLFEAASGHRRALEALLFAANQPLGLIELVERLPDARDQLPKLLTELEDTYRSRGVNLVGVAGKWQFRTAPDLVHLLRREVDEERKLSRAAVETLAIIAYHQPATRAEIEEIRGVSLSKGTLDVLMEAGWIKPRGRKRVPGRPLMFGTSEEFLIHFGLSSLDELPGIEELKAAGLLDSVDAAFANYGVRSEREGAAAKDEEEADDGQLDLEDMIAAVNEAEPE